jgi:hypothetical protein
MAVGPEAGGIEDGVPESGGEPTVIRATTVIPAAAANPTATANRARR